jgi:hypothetical protein
MEAFRASYRRLQTQPDREDRRFRILEAQGALFLDKLRAQTGDDKFFGLMSEFFTANSTRTVTAQAFLDKAGVAYEPPGPGTGASFVTADIGRVINTAVIVYGTEREAGANRYAAEVLQRDFLNQYEHQVPILKDFEASADALRHRDVIFIGRPEANSALAAWSRQLRLDYSGSVLRIANGVRASERNSLLLAAPNPLDPARMVLVVAGNDALRTVKLAQSVRESEEGAEYGVFDDGRKVQSGFLPR